MNYVYLIRIIFVLFCIFIFWIVIFTSTNIYIYIGLIYIVISDTHNIMAAICRICLSEESNLTEFFEPVSDEIIEKIKFCTGIVLQNINSLPSQMCNKCHTDLHIAHTFKIKCMNSEDSFWKHSQDNDKTNKCNGSNDNVKLKTRYNEHNNGVKKEQILKLKTVKPTVGVLKSKISIKKVKVTLKNPPELKLNTRRGVNKFKRLFCEPCQMKFSNRAESLEHKKLYHKEEQSWICEVCGKSYAHRSSQITHMHSHYPARYSCHDCDYSTYNKYDLIKHVRIHTGDKCFKCTQCPAAYRTSSNLRTHVRLLHERARPYACHICGKTYNDRATLNRHIDAHNDIKRHICNVCNAAFTKRSYWKKHLLKQHDIVIPNVRPGRQKAEVLLVDRSEKEIK
ncbi:uncharacterized protein [Epargyreus clarus]|uniref:uncharacterized protein n=1 Tax=Epargyreus clarus TaxID=520877 RepID=UPI003C2FCA49